MTRAIPLLALLLAACPPPPTASSPPAPPPEPRLELDATWTIVEQDATQIVLRYREGPHGVRVNLARTADGRQPGIAPIVNGRTMELRDADAIRPAFLPPLADRPPDEVVIEVQGPDLLIRLAGLPLAGLIEDPAAPPDPVLTWVRVRPRPGSIRFIVHGLAVWTLPAGTAVEELGDRRVLHTSWGRFEVDGAAPVTRGLAGPEGWWLDLTPSAAARQPYPRFGITWTPPARPISP